MFRLSFLLCAAPLWLAAQTYLLTTIAGNDSGVGDSGPAIEARIDAWKGGFVSDAQGNLFIAEGRGSGRCRPTASFAPSWVTASAAAPAMGRRSRHSFEPVSIAFASDRSIFVLDG